MKWKICLLFLMVIGGLSAQVPDCQITFGPWTDTIISPPSNNTTTQCTYWIMTYQVTGFSAISLQFESATGTSFGPGSFGAYSGTVASGVNPSVSVSCAMVTNCTSTYVGVVGWVRVNFQTHTGNGRIQGVLKGYKVGYPLGGQPIPGGSGCPGTTVTPCVVDGVTAAGMAPTTAPVLIGGQDGTNVETIRTDTGGRPQVVGAAASGAAKTGNPVLIGGQDGTNAETLKTDTAGRPQVVGAAGDSLAVAGNPVLMAVWDGTNVKIPIYCNARAIINTSTAAVIIAHSGTARTTICSITWASASAVNMAFTAGTGSTCGTGTSTLIGTLPSITTGELIFQSYAPLMLIPGDDFCMTPGTSVSTQGIVFYSYVP